MGKQRLVKLLNSSRQRWGGLDEKSSGTYIYMWVCVDIHICMYIYVCVYVYTYRQQDLLMDLHVRCKRKREFKDYSKIFDLIIWKDGVALYRGGKTVERPDLERKIRVWF